MFKSLALLFLFVSPLIVKSQPDWQLKKNEDGIKVYSKSSDNSRIKSIKVTCELQGSFSELTALLLDADAHKDWVFNTRSSYVVKQVSPGEQIYYSEIELPWPLANRDVVVLMTLNQDPDTKVLKVTADAIKSDVQGRKGIVRVAHSSVVWKVTSPTTGKLNVEYIAHADPGGSVPAWIANTFSTKGPLETFKRLKQLIASRAYASANYAFIED